MSITLTPEQETWIKAHVATGDFASVEEAAISGARMRIRPVLMTSLAFVLGLAPLVFATGVASLTRRGVGTAVFGGMIAATTLGVFAIPLLYIAFERARSWRWRRASRRVQQRSS